MTADAPDAAAVWFFSVGALAVCGCIWMLVYVRIFLPSPQRWIIVLVCVGAISLGAMFGAIVLHSLR